MYRVQRFLETPGLKLLHRSRTHSGFAGLWLSVHDGGGAQERLDALESFLSTISPAHPGASQFDKAVSN